MGKEERWSARSNIGVVVRGRFNFVLGKSFSEVGPDGLKYIGSDISNAYVWDAWQAGILGWDWEFYLERPLDRRS